MKTLALFLSLAVFAITSLSADETKKPTVTHVDVAAAEKLVKEGKVTVLDVRTSDEYKEGHIDGATNIDFTENNFASEVKKLDKDKPILVHCAAGGRSTKSLPTLEKEGFTQVYHLDGGFKDWVAKGKPVAK